MILQRFCGERGKIMHYAEDSHTELKEIVNTEFKKEVVAFANTDGGDIYVGISKDGRPVGVTDAPREMERISCMIRDGIKPDLTRYSSVESFLDGNAEIIKVSVSRGPKSPYHLTDRGLKPGGVYVRHGVTSVPVNDDAIRQMLRESDGVVFDKSRSPIQELTFDYADKSFEERGVAFGPQNKRTLNLMDSDGYYTNAALLLSDQCAHSIKCAVYDGVGKTTFRARKEFFGSVLRQLDEAYEYIELNNNQNPSIDGLHRIDHPDYPSAALREGLINTVAHRDYDFSGSTLVNIYTDRVEFVSLGGLVKGLTLEDVLGGISQPRNMILANIFYRLELIESYGTGIKRIFESYAGQPQQPQIKAAPASFVLTLPKMNGKHTPAPADNSPKKRVMEFIVNRGRITRKDVENLLGCSQYPAFSVLSKLEKEGRIKRVGKARATTYEAL